MAMSEEEVRKSYPLLACYYRVEIGPDTVAFSEVSGCDVAYEVATHKESPMAGGAPGPRTMLMPSQRTNPTITLKKGLVPADSVANLYGWIATVKGNVVEKKDIFVRLCNEEGAPVISWKVTNAFPVKLTAPSFSATSNDVAVESMELRADFVTLELT